MRKNITHKTKPKHKHHTSIKQKNNVKKHTRKYGKKQQRRTRRNGGMFRRMCRGLSCMQPQPQIDVISPEETRTMNSVPSVPLSNVDYLGEPLTVIDKMSANVKLTKLKKIIHVRKLTYTQIINEYIAIIDETPNEDELQYISVRYKQFLSKPENVKYKQVFDIVREYMKQYKNAKMNSWPPAASKKDKLRKLIVMLIQMYFKKQNADLAEIGLSLPGESELSPEEIEYESMMADLNEIQLNESTLSPEEIEYEKLVAEEERNRR